MASAQVDLTTIPISPGGSNNADSSSDSKVDDITVFHDKENFTVKHPLMHRWTLWFTKPASGKVSRLARLKRPMSERGILENQMLTSSDRATTGTTS